MAHSGQIHLQPDDATSFATPPSAVVAPEVPGSVTYDWVGGAGDNGNGDWNTAADWSTDAVPGASATATFATGNFGYTVTGDATIGAIVVDGDGVTFDGTLTQNADGAATFLTALDYGSVTLDSNSFVTGGALDFTQGSLLQVQGILITTGGDADAVLVNGLGAQMIDSGNLLLNQLYVQNGASFAGDVTLNNGGNITLDTSSEFGGGSLTLLGSATLYDALAPGGTTGSGSVSDNIAFGNPGSTLDLASDPGVAFLVSGDISGDGNLLVSGGAVELAGTLSYTGSTTVTDGALQIDNLSNAINGPVFLTDGEFAFAAANGTAFSSVVTTVVGGGTSDTVSAGGATLLVYASSTSLSFIGGEGGSTVVAGSGTLNVAGGTNAGPGTGDYIFGGSGALNFTGGDSYDTVFGGAGIVNATGGSGADLIYGGTSGQDTLSTGAGNSTIVGGAGTSFFANGAGNAVVVAGASALINASAASGNDTLYAGGTATTIIGGYAGTEADVLGSGNATVYSGSGISDIFGNTGDVQLYLTQGFGGGTINVVGLTLAQLDITLVNYAPGEAQQALANDTVTGGNTFLTLSDNTHIDLWGITGLTNQNFS
jgi:hypothetical protein